MSAEITTLRSCKQTEWRLLKWLFILRALDRLGRRKFDSAFTIHKSGLKRALVLIETRFDFFTAHALGLELVDDFKFDSLDFEHGGRASCCSALCCKGRSSAIRPWSNGLIVNVS